LFVARARCRSFRIPAKMHPVLAFISLVVLAANFVRGLTLIVPSQLNDTGFNTITWSTVPTDPSSFTVVILNKKLNIAADTLDTVTTSDLSIKFNLPGLPDGDGYTVVAYAVGDTSTPLYTSQEVKVVESRDPNSTSGSSTSTAAQSASSPATSASNTANAGVPAAPSNSATFPGSGTGTGTGDGSGAATRNGVFTGAAFAGLVGVVLGLAL